MVTSTQSLIETTPEQLTMLDDQVVAQAEAELARNPQFTAARFFSRFPASYKEIVRLRSEGMSHKAISRIMRCSRNLVAAIEKREAQTVAVEHLKQVASSNYRHLARLSAERLEEMLLDNDAKLSPKDLAVLIGILEDKAQLLGGGPTSRMEINLGEHSHDDLQSYIAGLREKATERMGLGGESPEQRDGKIIDILPGSEASDTGSGSPADKAREASTGGSEGFAAASETAGAGGKAEGKATGTDEVSDV